FHRSASAITRLNLKSNLSVHAKPLRPLIYHLRVKGIPAIPRLGSVYILLSWT
ncbi:Bgt-20216, partial [Blumeria graminis f. sp. tritici]